MQPPALRMLILSPHCFVSCLELLASPSQSTLAGLPFCQRMFAASRCLCGLVLPSCVSTLQSNEHRLGWDHWHVVAELSALISICPKWLGVCTGWRGVLGCSGDAPGCYGLFEQTSFLPSTPRLTCRQILLFWISQWSSLFWAKSSLMGSYTGSWSLSVGLDSWWVLWAKSSKACLLERVPCHQKACGRGLEEEDELFPVWAWGLQVLFGQ